MDSLLVIWPDGKSQTFKNLDSTLKKLTLKYVDAGLENEIKNSISPYFTSIENIINFEHRESDFLDFNENAALHKMLSRFGPVVAQGDINSDGLEDIVIGGAFRGSETLIFTQNNTGNFSKVQDIGTSREMEVGALRLFDADSDGDQDLIIAGGSCESPLENPIAFQPQLWINDGKGKFTKNGNLPKMNVSGQVIEPLDYDRDGDLDLFLGGRITPYQYPKEADSYILKNENGKFTDVTARVAPFLKNFGMVCDAAIGDFDHDGWVDMATVGE